MGGNDIRAILGKNIRVFRSHRNWSQADLAENAGISVTFLSDIERGNKWPYPDTLSNIAGALDIEVDVLFRRERTGEGVEIDPNVQEQMARFVKDVSLTLHKSVALSINQSLDHITRQYLPDMH
jgi:transcriptional regulator with XRE-family HTH domain